MGVGVEPEGLDEPQEEAAAEHEQMDESIEECHLEIDAMLDGAFSNHIRTMPTVPDLDTDEAQEPSSEVKAVALPTASPPSQMAAVQAIAVPLASPPSQMAEVQAIAVPVASPPSQMAEVHAIAVPVASPPVQIAEVQAIAVPVASPPVQMAEVQVIAVPVASPPAPTTEVSASSAELKPAHAPKPRIVDVDSIPTPQRKRNDFNQTAATPENARIKMLREVLAKLKNLICTNPHRCMCAHVCVIHITAVACAQALP